MISGATRGKGGPGLARHLADVARNNDETRLGASRGLIRFGLPDQVEELAELVAHVRHAMPILHIHADPARPWTIKQWRLYRTSMELEFGLQKQPFVEAIHVKATREHRHRVYSLVRPNGACIRLGHDYARREKLSRAAELRAGEPLTKGRHNYAVFHALRREGQDVAAQAIAEAGLLTGERATAPLSPRERMQQERTGTDLALEQAAAWSAWRMADSGRAFIAALIEKGFTAARRSTAVALLIDATGGVHFWLAPSRWRAPFQPPKSCRNSDAGRTPDSISRSRARVQATYSRCRSVS